MRLTKLLEWYAEGMVYRLNGHSGRTFGFHEISGDSRVWGDKNFWISFSICPKKWLTWNISIAIEKCLLLIAIKNFSTDLRLLSSKLDKSAWMSKQTKIFQRSDRLFPKFFCKFEKKINIKFNFFYNFSPTAY